MSFSLCDLDMMKLTEAGKGCLFHGHSSHDFKNVSIFYLRTFPPIASWHL